MCAIRTVRWQLAQRTAISRHVVIVASARGSGASLDRTVSGGPMRSSGARIGKGAASRPSAARPRLGQRATETGLNGYPQPGARMRRPCVEAAARGRRAGGSASTCVRPPTLKAGSRGGARACVLVAYLPYDKYGTVLRPRGPRHLTPWSRTCSEVYGTRIATRVDLIWASLATT